MTNSELKAKWQQAVWERDAGISDAPEGIEVAVAIAQGDTKLLFWFVNKLIERLPDDSQEQQP